MIAMYIYSYIYSSIVGVAVSHLLQLEALFQAFLALIVAYKEYSDTTIVLNIQVILLNTPGRRMLVLR
jgi:hypothetical protein